MITNILEGDVSWKEAALRLGEELARVRPKNYPKLTAEKWLDWALKQIRANESNTGN